jgi:hypothetical protein
MHVSAIVLGLFILFALAFVGGLGSALYTYSALASAISVILVGLLTVASKADRAATLLTMLAIFTWLPVVFHRFSGQWGLDWGGLLCDALYLTFLALLFHQQRTNTFKHPNVGRA